MSFPNDLKPADAFGMLAAALYIDRAPWRIATGERGKPTPLCLVWGHYMDAPATTAAGACAGAA